MPPEDHTQSAPPVPDYTLLRLIGRGSYGDVWLARGATGMLRAVKVVWRDRFSDIEPYEREFRGLTDFIRLTQGEARQLALLHVGRNDDAGFFYYIMELADDVVTGREIDPDCYAPLTLKTLRDQTDFVPADDVLRYAIELAAGLSDLHRTGLVHRDIKPSNIIIVDGRPKLADVGLVSVETEAKTFVGTEGFVPPEGPGTQAADIFSLGKVLYELVSGMDRQDFPSLPTDIAERADRVEMLELNEIIIKACAPSAAERYSDAETLLHELNLLEAGKSVRRLRFAEKGLAQARKWILAAVAFAIVAGIGAALERNRANEEAAGRAAAEAELAALTRRTLYDASLAAAQRALQTDNYGVAREALERSIPQPGDPDLRHFEWHALWREAQGDPAEVIRASGDTVTRLEPSPDGQWMAADNRLPVVDIFDQLTGELVQSIEGVHRVAGFTSDGQRIIGTTPSFEIETWSVEAGSPDGIPNKLGINRPLQVHSSLPHLLYFEDATDDGPHRLGVWDFENGRNEKSHEITHKDSAGNRWIFHSAAATPELDRVLLATTAGIGSLTSQTVQLVNMLTGEQIWSYEVEDFHTPIAISSDGGRFAIEEDDLIIRGSANPLVNQYSAGLSSVGHRISFDRKGQRLIAPIYGNQLIEFQFAPSRAVRQMRGSSSQVEVVSYDTNETHIWSADRKGEIRRWPRNNTKAFATQADDFVRSGESSFLALEISDDSDKLAALRATGEMMVWDLPSLQVQWKRSDIQDIIWIDEDDCWTLLKSGQVVNLSPDDGHIVQQLSFGLDSPALYRVSSSPQNRYWVVELVNGDFIFWDSKNDEVINRVPRSAIGLEHHQATALLVTDEGTVVSADTRQRLLIWRGKDGQILHNEESLNRINRMRLSQDGSLLSTTGGHQNARILRVSDLGVVRSFPGTRTNGFDLSFHPTEPLVATQTLKGTITLHNFQSGKVHPPLELHSQPEEAISGQVSHLEFSTDGKTLAVADLEGRIRVWRRD